MGGSFDPIHFGHLRSAIEVKEQLGLDQIQLVPCHIPPHKEDTHASAEHRAHMVQLAVQDHQDLEVNPIELNQSTTSYTVDTLRQIRQQLGSEVVLCFVIGMDSLVTLHTWHQWQQITDYCHLVVALRPGSSPNNLQSEVADFLRNKQCSPEEVKQSPQGHIIICETTKLDISSTYIRQLVREGHSPRFLLPAAVQHYIQQQQLYF